MYRMLREKNEGLAPDMVAFAQELIRVQSISRNEKNIAKLIENKMNELGYDRVFVDQAGNVVGLLIGRRSEPTLLLNCHMDTVPVTSEDKWFRPPLDAVVEDRKLFGLGAADCKGGLAAQIYAGALLKHSLLPIDGNLIVAATVAEENGLSVGVKHLMDKTLPELGLKPDYAILGEPTSMGLYYGHDGWVELDVRVEGTDPFQVDDAASEVLTDLSAVSGTGRSDSELEEVMINQPRFEEERGFRRATIRMARRLRDTENVKDVVNQIKRNAVHAVQPAGAVAVEVMIRQENQQLSDGAMSLVRHITHAWSTDPFHPIMDRSRQALSAAGCDVRPGKWQLDRLGMGTAGGVLVKEYNLPTIGYGPGEERLAHACNEYVDIDNMAEIAFGTSVIAHSLIGVPVYGWTSDEI